ncbi:MAG: hypothetical protein HZT41_08090 [Dechloromonas sp.]|nr:MAG: hypothetical protein HZT41_08090 [Dechloromonas sp.]
MSGIEALLRGIDSTDALSSQDTWLSRRDPRALILTTLAFLVVVVSFPRHAVAALLPLALYPVVLARLGRIPLPMVGSRVLLALPFALMIGLFNPSSTRARAPNCWDSRFPEAGCRLPRSWFAPPLPWRRQPCFSRRRGCPGSAPV